jgi:hypothetical protein
MGKIRQLSLLGLVIGGMFILIGCSGGGGSSGGSSSSSTTTTTTTTTTAAGSEFVGSWRMSDSNDTFYFYFDSNNTFVGCDVPDRTRVHFSGTWSVSGGTLRGPFTNPGVGTGEIVCTITNNVMSMDFIEHWHTPFKHLAFTGSKF